MLLPVDLGHLMPEIRRLFEELARSRPQRRALVSGECQVGQDVYETERTIEIVLDLPGITADQCRVMIKSGVVLVVGEKERREIADGPASFHLVERDFGRFARAVRVHAAIDASQARARLKNGELRIVLPKLQDRRGRELTVTVETDATSAAE